MTSSESRRFTDREVALVLKRAAEIDEKEGAGDGGGLSLRDLEEIGREVGITRDAIVRAVGSLEKRSLPGSSWAGAPLVRRALHVVPGEVGEGTVAELVRLVDERADHAGSVSEALGSVRWTASDRLHSMHVAITPARGETTIQVVEKAVPRIRRVFHLLPAAWGAMLAAPFVSTVAMPVAGTVATVGLAAAAGAGIGRLAWTWMSARSRDRVERLAEGLSRHAREATAAPPRTDSDSRRADAT